MVTLTIKQDADLEVIAKGMVPWLKSRPHCPYSAIRMELKNRAIDTSVEAMKFSDWYNYYSQAKKESGHLQAEHKDDRGPQ